MDRQTISDYASRFAKPLRRFLNRRGVPGAMIEDVSQVVWFRLYRYHISEESIKRPLSYIQRTALNVMRSEMSCCRHTKTHADIDDFVETLEDGFNCEGYRLSEERKKIVRAAIDSLPARQRQMLWMHLYQMTYQQIAHTMNVSDGIVIRSLRSAYSSLRKNEKIQEICRDLG